MAFCSTAQPKFVKKNGITICVFLGDIGKEDCRGEKGHPREFVENYESRFTTMSKRKHLEIMFTFSGSDPSSRVIVRREILRTGVLFVAVKKLIRLLMKARQILINPVQQRELPEARCQKNELHLLYHGHFARTVELIFFYEVQNKWQ